MKNSIEFRQNGYGQWRVSTVYYGKVISMHFTDAPMYDLIKGKERGYKKAIGVLRKRVIEACLFLK